MEIHIIPHTDTGLRHKASTKCGCVPEATADNNRNCKIFKHSHVGPAEDKFVIKIKK